MNRMLAEQIVDAIEAFVEKKIVQAREDARPHVGPNFQQSYDDVDTARSELKRTLELVETLESI